LAPSAALLPPPSPHHPQQRRRASSATRPHSAAMLSRVQEKQNMRVSSARPSLLRAFTSTQPPQQNPVHPTKPTQRWRSMREEAHQNEAMRMRDEVASLREQLIDEERALLEKESELADERERSQNSERDLRAQYSLLSSEHAKLQAYAEASRRQQEELRRRLEQQTIASSPSAGASVHRGYARGDKATRFYFRCAARPHVTTSSSSSGSAAAAEKEDVPFSPMTASSLQQTRREMLHFDVMLKPGESFSAPADESLRGRAATGEGLELAYILREGSSLEPELWEDLPALDHLRAGLLSLGADEMEAMALKLVDQERRLHEMEYRCRAAEESEARMAAMEREIEAAALRALAQDRALAQAQSEVEASQAAAEEAAAAASSSEFGGEELKGAAALLAQLAPDLLLALANLTPDQLAALSRALLAGDGKLLATLAQMPADQLELFVDMAAKLGALGAEALESLSAALFAPGDLLAVLTRMSPEQVTAMAALMGEMTELSPEALRLLADSLLGGDPSLLRALATDASLGKAAQRLAVDPALAMALSEGLLDGIADDLALLREVQRLVSNPDLAAAIKSGILNDPRLQKLLKDPDMLKEVLEIAATVSLETLQQMKELLGDPHLAALIAGGGAQKLLSGAVALAAAIDTECEHAERQMSGNASPFVGKEDIRVLFPQVWSEAHLASFEQPLDELDISALGQGAIDAELFTMRRELNKLNKDPEGALPEFLRTWMNHHLQEHGSEPFTGPLSLSMEDGRVLEVLAERLTGAKLSPRKDPGMRLVHAADALVEARMVPPPLRDCFVLGVAEGNGPSVIGMLSCLFASQPSLESISLPEHENKLLQSLAVAARTSMSQGDMGKALEYMTKIRHQWTSVAVRRMHAREACHQFGILAGSQLMVSLMSKAASLIAPKDACALAKDLHAFTNIDPARFADIPGFGDANEMIALLREFFKLLRGVYKFYSVGGMLSMGEMRVLAKEAQLEDKELTSAKIDIAFVRANREDEKDVDNPDNECTPEEFIEVLIRCACVRFSKELSKGGAAKCMRRLITELLLVNAQVVEEQGFRSALQEEAVLWVLEVADKELKQVFNHYAALDGNRKTINLKEFDRMLGDADLLQSGRLVKGDLPRILGYSQSDNDVSELDFKEFQEVICVCAMFYEPMPYIPIGKRVQGFLLKQLIPGLADNIKSINVSRLKKAFTQVRAANFLKG